MTVKRHQTHFDVSARDGATPALLAVKRSLGGVETAALSLGRTFAGVLSATAAMGLTREMVRQTIDAEKAQNRLQAVLRATGSAGGFAKGELDDLAQSLSRTTQFDDDALRNAQATLLKFGNISGEVFREGLKLSADLAAFMGTDVAEAAQMIGKSLQSPTEGLQMMERQFGKLTEAEEKHIASLVKHGRSIEAQNAVLEIWQQKIGGTAELMNTGLTKASNDVGKAWDDMLKSFGRTGPVGDIVRGTLEGIASVLRDIEGLAGGQAADPMRKFNLGLSSLEEEERALAARLARADEVARRRNSLASAAQADQLRARLAAIRTERRAILAEMRKTEDALTFEGIATGWEGAAAAGMRPPPKLGGGAKQKSWREENREWLNEQERVSRELVAGEEAAATDSREAWQAYTDGRLEQERRIKAERDAGLKAWFETIDREQEEAIAMGEAFLEAEAARKAAIKNTDDAARQLGFTFQSAFEDAILEGKRFSEVLKGIEMDIARIIVRKTATEPLGNAIAQWASGLNLFGRGGLFGSEVASSGMDFGGPKAMGGPVMAGKTYLVGESGPELLHMGGASGHVSSNVGGSYSPVYNIHIDSRSDRAAVAADVERALRASEARMLRSMRYNGAFGRAAADA